jgi:PAS domain S-box-containing protein
MGSDTTNSQKIRARFEPSLNFYSQVIDSLQDYSIFTLDTDTNINSWNSGSEKILGYSRDEVIGQHFDIIFTEEDKRANIPQNEIDISKSEGRASDNRWHVRRDGSKFFAYGLVFPIMDDDDNIIGYVKILRDITEGRKKEEAIVRYIRDLEQLNTHKESILAILSHDLRSPLSGIIGSVEYLRTNLDTMEKDEIVEMLDLIHKTSTDELDMLDYLVEWARIKYASEIHSPTNVELVKYVNLVFESLGEEAKLNAINLHHEVELNTSVFVDEKMLLSVLRNIVSNAIKHSREGGKITVQARLKDSKTIVEIRDTGFGMSKEIQEKLFTPQMHTLAMARGDKKGAGIGLLLVKGFVEKSGGEIWVESVEGEGSSFYFSLPADQPPVKPENTEMGGFDDIP